jgi:hypothetical protein
MKKRDEMLVAAVRVVRLIRRVDLDVHVEVGRDVKPAVLQRHHARSRVSGGVWTLFIIAPTPASRIDEKY